MPKHYNYVDPDEPQPLDLFVRDMQRGTCGRNHAIPWCGEGVIEERPNGSSWQQNYAFLMDRVHRDRRARMARAEWYRRNSTHRRWHRMKKHNVKLRQLRSDLKKVGFTCRAGGSHQIWTAPDNSGRVTLPNGGRDADPACAQDVHYAIAEYATRTRLAKEYGLKADSKAMRYVVAVHAEPGKPAAWYADRLGFKLDRGGTATATLNNMARKGAVHKQPGKRPRVWGPGPMPVGVTVDVDGAMAALDAVEAANPVPSFVELTAIDGVQYMSTDIATLEEPVEEETPDPTSWDTAVAELEERYERACRDVTDAEAMLAEAKAQRDELEPTIIRVREALETLKEVLS